MPAHHHSLRCRGQQTRSGAIEAGGAASNRPHERGAAEQVLSKCSAAASTTSSALPGKLQAHELCTQQHPHVPLPTLFSWLIKHPVSSMACHSSTHLYPPPVARCWPLAEHKNRAQQHPQLQGKAASCAPASTTSSTPSARRSAALSSSAKLTCPAEVETEILPGCEAMQRGCLVGRQLLREVGPPAD